MIPKYIHRARSILIPTLGKASQSIDMSDFKFSPNEVSIDTKYNSSDRILCFGETNYNFPLMISKHLQNGTVIVTSLPKHLDRSFQSIGAAKIKSRLDALQKKGVILHKDLHPDDFHKYFPSNSVDKIVSNFPLVDVRISDISRYKKITNELKKTSGNNVPFLSLPKSINMKDPQSRTTPVASFHARQVRKKLMIAYLKGLFTGAERMLNPGGQVHLRIGRQLHLAGILRLSAADSKFRLIKEINLKNLEPNILKKMGADLKMIERRTKIKNKEEIVANKGAPELKERKEHRAWLLVLERISDESMESLIEESKQIEGSHSFIPDPSQTTGISGNEEDKKNQFDSEGESDSEDEEADHFDHEQEENREEDQDSKDYISVSPEKVPDSLAYLSIHRKIYLSDDNDQSDSFSSSPFSASRTEYDSIQSKALKQAIHLRHDDEDEEEKEVHARQQRVQNTAHSNRSRMSVNLTNMERLWDEQARGFAADFVSRRQEEFGSGLTFPSLQEDGQAFEDQFEVSDDEEETLDEKVDYSNALKSMEEFAPRDIQADIQNDPSVRFSGMVSPPPVSRLAGRSSREDDAANRDVNAHVTLHDARNGLNGSDNKSKMKSMLESLASGGRRRRIIVLRDGGLTMDAAKRMSRKRRL